MQTFLHLPKFPINFNSYYLTPLLQFFIILISMDQIQILDGGFGTEISKRTKVSIDDDALWSARFLATNKEEVINTHLEFLKVGANVIATDTYQASIDAFVEHLNLNEKESYNLIKEAVDLAKRARNVYITNNSMGNELISIAGSVGSYGASLHNGSEYTGCYKDFVSHEELREWHSPRIEALIEGGVDLLAFETIPCKKEAEVLLDILGKHSNVKAWLSFNCKDGTSLASGENFQSTLLSCYSMNPGQLVAIGANCISPKIVNELFSEINSNTNTPIPLIVYPNSGELYSKEQGWIASDPCKPIESYVENWLDLGITWIGGCCQVSANEIAKIKKAVDNYVMKRSVIT